MIIPPMIQKQIASQSSPMDNRFFHHAINALESMNKTTEENYCYDDIAKAANILERIYKGFLQAAHNHCDFYTLPSASFLDNDHDIFGIVMEIKQYFPDVFPRQNREEWRITKNFYRDLRMAYTDSRYSTYPNYSEFVNLREYVNEQYKMISDYIKEGNLTQTSELDYDSEASHD